MDKSDAPTLFNVGNAAAVKTWGDYCLDLKDTDAYKALTTTSFNQEDANKVYSVGLCYEAYGIIVNKALLAKAGYKLEDIKDFDSLKKVAEDIHARAATLGFDAFTSAGLDDSSSWRFSGHLANMPLLFSMKAEMLSGQSALQQSLVNILTTSKQFGIFTQQILLQTSQSLLQLVLMLKLNLVRAKQYSIRMVHGNLLTLQTKKSML